MSGTVRSFSTAARVHPAFLPHLRPSPRRAPIRRWLKTAVVITAVGYASKTYLDRTRDQRRASAVAHEHDSVERQRMMENLYGGRETLEDLEKGVAEYGRR
ncbi:hypothetical protein TARUN_7937 [Trichoderma arundinaceum]|uniref:Uncharacterized protein n=1 Tax=Trichoderma arundinaceum TaxID=490622 RepID=A0A395NE69_TRIAR|nr:hypothetical protein TARUN_7937 [Trichoderma arundinaceum]